MKRIINDTLRIFLITLISGLMLGLVYEVTKEPIKEANDNAKRESLEKVFPDASAYSDPCDIENTEELFKQYDLEGVRIDEVISCFEATSSTGQPLGYCITATSSKGYGGDITVMIGISRDKGTVLGISILSLDETPGLGMKSTEETFYGQYSKENYIGLFNVTKTGAKAENEIDAISGATKTSRAVTDAVNAAVAYYMNFLAEGGTK